MSISPRSSVSVRPGALAAAGSSRGSNFGFGPLARDVLSRLAPARVWSAARALLADDVWVTRIVLVFLVSQCVWIGWDQPGALGWENDGVAPRDFFTGVADNLLPGHGHRYPLFHNALLLVLCLPVLAIAAISALITGVPVVSAVLSVPSMTAVSLLCKLFHVVLNGAMLLLLARVARQLFGETAARACVLFATVSLTIGYYGRVSNLDGPYMFWTVLALLLSMRVMDRGELGDYRLLGFSIAASVATKDQAYAGYVLAAPVYLVLLPAFRPGFFAAGRGHFRALLSTLASTLLSYAVLSGAVFNPTGLWTRIALLTGPNSQQWREYARTSAGVLLNIEDLWRAQSAFFWHWSLVALAWAGVALALFAPASPRERWLRALPFAFAVSSVLMFVIPVARCEHRFVLPLGVWLCIYGGASIASLARCRVQIVGRSLLLAAGLGWLASLWQCVELGLTQLGDARQGVRVALARLPAGSVVETYGPPVYQPHFDFSAASPYRIERIGKEPPRTRSRMLHVSEVVDDYVNVSRRQPAAVLVPEGFARWFLAREFRPGEAPSVRWLESQADTDAVAYFRELMGGRLDGYDLVLSAAAELPAWALLLNAHPIAVHDSTANRMLLFVRHDVAQSLRFAQRSSGLRDGDG